MEVVQDFINSPSLEKFKNISSSQRRSLLEEYFKVCNLAEIWYLIVYRIIALFVNPEARALDCKGFPALGAVFMFSRV